MARRAPMLALSCLVACAGASPTPSAGDEPVRTAPDPAPGTEPAPEPAPPPGPPPNVTLLGETTDDGSVRVVVQNRDADDVKLERFVTVERERETGFAPIAKDARVPFSCDAPAEGCAELVPGAELRSATWRAPAGRAQCADAEAPKPLAGAYRFVARSCAGARVEGTPFDVR